MKIRDIATVIIVSASAFHANATTQNEQLLASAIDHERAVLKATLDSKPIVETYFQFTPNGSNNPVSDNYSIAEVGLARRLSSNNYETKPSGSAWHTMLELATASTIGRTQQVDAAAFADMLTPDPMGFNNTTYKFLFIRKEFLGRRKTALYDVEPDDRRHEKGRFLGRIWVDEQDQVIVRFVGVFRGPESKDHPEFLHFDSWRKRTTNGRWVPYAIYFEDNVRGSTVHGQVRLWGYKLHRFGAAGDSDMTDMQVKQAEDQSETSEDVSPLQATFDWRKQAEDNVIDRLEAAGVLAPKSDFEKILNQIVVNLELPSNINIPVDCRVMLTLPVEATVVDRTILLSKGLIDTIPSEEALASVVALELAHIQLGHRLDTKFAFSDRLFFNNTETFERLRLAHTEKDNREAADLAGKLLATSIYKDKMTGVADYYAVLSDSEKRLPGLTHACLGDALLDETAAPWISNALPSANLKEAYASPTLAPLPLSSALATEPINDTVTQIFPRLAPSNPSEIRPFQILPVYMNLQPNGGPNAQVSMSEGNEAAQK